MYQNNPLALTMVDLLCCQYKPLASICGSVFQPVQMGVASVHL